MTEMVEGTLEIDHERGVVYFHAYGLDAIKRFGAVTVLRIQGLPKPIPKNTQLDVNHMHGASWRSEGGEDYG